MTLPRTPVGTTEGYDLWAEGYDGLDNPLIAMTTLAMRGWTPKLDGRRVLELGCGTGRNLAFFLSAGAEYVGVDGSAGMLEKARAREGGERAQWLHADLTRPLPPGLGPFDVVFFSLVFEHSSAVLPLVQAAAAVARGGAVFKAYELHADLQEAGTKAHFRVGDRELELPSFAHPAAEYREALRQVGWESVSTVDWLATAEACGLSAKLNRYAGRAVLIEVTAQRSARDP